MAWNSYHNQKKVMNNNTIIIFIFGIVLMSCHKSYYQASSTNQNRFGGEKLENANYMTEVNDQVLFISDLSELTQDQTNSKHIYFKSKEVHKNFEGFDLKIDAISSIRRISIQNQLSKEKDEQLHKVKRKDSGFDSLAVNTMKKQLGELEKKLQGYIKEGKDNQLINFSENLLIEVDESLKTLNQGNPA